MDKLQENEAAHPIVLDCHVAMDLWLFQMPHLQALASDLTAGRLTWWATDAICQELRHEARKMAARHAKLGADDAHRLEQAVQHHLRVVTDAEVVGALPLTRPRCTDPNDQMFVDLAWVLAPCTLLTQDKALLKLRKPLARRGVVVRRVSIADGPVNLSETARVDLG